jgi:pyruvate kinase
MNIARFNFSHGDHEGHAAVLARLREAVASRPGKHVAVMLDTKGPEIRTGFFEEKYNGKLSLKAGQDLELVTDYAFKGNENQLAVSYPSLPTSVEVGGQVLAADGSLVMTVKEIRETSVVVTVINSCTLGERKNMNLPGCIVDLPTLTEKDINDLVNWGLVQGIDFIAASFVRKGSDIDRIREVLGPPGRGIKIIAKIENQEGLDNFDEVLEKTDAVMVARGDLGMEIAPEKVFLAQKMMIKKCNIAGKPVVTATQMFESMITNPRPTRAECTDVANAVLDGSDAVMLSGETANGAYPTQAVSTMGRTCCEAEGVLDYNQVFLNIRDGVLSQKGAMDTTEAVASSAVKTAMDIDAKMLVVLSESGSTARMVAKYRPEMPLLVLTGMAEVARQCKGYLRGTEVVAVGSMIGTDSVITRALDEGKKLGYVNTGDNVVVVHGLQEATAGATNLLKVLTVE